MTQRKIALSIEEAADYTGIGRNTLRQLVEWKKLPVLKVGRKVLIKTDILEMFMEANEGRDLRDRGNRQRFYQTEAMIYLHARRLYHVLLLIRNQELMFVKERRM
jgi:excisionase family DNA binding protein